MTSQIEKVILVDENDQPVGEMEKLEAHLQARLHRAFSVFVFNDQNELMLQQRAFTKYHSPGLWTNTCCSHPRPGEDLFQAARRRLIEEMGFECSLEKIFDFIYRAELDQGITEHEFDHVLIGRFNGLPVVNPDEVAQWKWMSLDDLQKDLSENPHHYTVWFRIAFDRVRSHLTQHPAISTTH